MHLIHTTTNELYLPTRLIYTVAAPEELRAWFTRHPAFAWDSDRRRWAWEYDRSCRKLGFSPEYAETVRRTGGLVLASCYLKGGTLQVYTRCGLRAVKFLVFFDQQVKRTIAMGEFVDKYNLVTLTANPRDVPQPEDVFADESRLEFFDIAALLDSAKTPAEMKATMELIRLRSLTETLAPLVRHRLEAFYCDGPKAMETSMQLRDTLAMIQHQSKTPINPLEEIRKMVVGMTPGGGAS